MNRVVADPKFAGPLPGPWDPAWMVPDSDNVHTAVEQVLQMFRLRSDSPAIGTGRRFDQGLDGFSTDFWGQSFGTGNISIGPDQTVYAPVPQLYAVVYAENDTATVRMNEGLAPPDVSKLSLEASVDGSQFAPITLSATPVWNSANTTVQFQFNDLYTGTDPQYSISFRAFYDGKDPTPIYTLDQIDRKNVALVLDIASCDAGSTYPAGGVTPENLFNGKGMDVYTPAGVHDSNGDGITMWMTDYRTALSNVWAAGHFVKTYKLKSIYIWNYNQESIYADDETFRGLKNVIIEYQNAGGNWVAIPPESGDYHVLPKGTGLPLPCSYILDVSAQNITAQAIRVSAAPTDPTYGNGDYYGLSAVLVTGGYDTDWGIYTQATVGGTTTSDVPGVTDNGSALITAAPDRGYVLVGLFVNGTDMMGSVSPDGKLAINGITEDKQVSAVYALQQ